MIIIPAIDIKGGRVVRLSQGKADRETVYSESPVEIAKQWAASGAQMIHVVDLDGAFTGELKNIDIIKSIKDQTGVSIEFGGGIRSEAQARVAFEAGVSRIVIGSRALDKKFLGSMLNNFGSQKIVVGIDAMDGVVRVNGWTSDSKVSAAELANIVREAGVETVIYTNITKDGMMTGPDTDGIKDLIRSADIDVIASGGVSSIEDIIKLKNLNEERLAAVIIGKALYEKKLDLKKAIAICSQKE